VPVRYDVYVHNRDGTVDRYGQVISLPAGCDRPQNLDVWNADRLLSAADHLRRLLRQCEAQYKRAKNSIQ
jgi:hypothetical protein